MNTKHRPFARRIVLVGAAAAVAPLVIGAAALSAGSPLASGADRATGIVGVDGLPVVAREISGDLVVDWLDEPPAGHSLDAAGETEAEHAAHGAAPADDESDATDEGIGDPTITLAAGGGSGSGGVAGQGFSAVSSSVRWLDSGYTIRLTGGDRRVEQYRDELEAAARGASAAGGLPVRVAGGFGGPTTASRGEMVVTLEQGPCGSPAYGCGGPTMQSGRIVGGRVWINPAALGAAAEDRLNLAAHELAHTLGLHHYSGDWTDGRQAMHPTLSRTTTYRDGDRRGLRYMAGGFDRTAGQVTGIGYAAGQLHVRGTVASGSKARLVLGKEWADVTATGGRFYALIPAGAGRHRVCGRSLDAAAGFTRDLGCAEVHAPGTPFGRLEVVENSFETITVRGWAIDPQTAAPVSVEVRRNGKLVSTAKAEAARADVDRAHANYGPNHGFALEVPGVSGGNDICVRILGVGAGGNADLGCRRVTHSVMPIGGYEATPTNLGVTFNGWAIDPNTPSPVTMKVTVNGQVPAAPGQFQAGESRAELGRKYPAYGPNHGFSQSVVLAPGRHEVCLTIVNVGQGKDRRLGCSEVRVDAPATLTRSLGVAGTGAVTQPVTEVVSGALGAVGSLLNR